MILPHYIIYNKKFNLKLSMTYENKFTFLTHHVEILRSSYLHWTGNPFFDQYIAHENAVEALFVAPFAVLSHGIGVENTHSPMEY